MTKLEINQRVLITKGTHEGKHGTIFEFTPKMVRIKLDGSNQLVLKKKTNVESASQAEATVSPAEANSVGDIPQAAAAPIEANSNENLAPALGRKKVHITTGGLTFTGASLESILNDIKSDIVKGIGAIEGNLHFLRVSKSILVEFQDALHAQSAVVNGVVINGLRCNAAYCQDASPIKPPGPRAEMPKKQVVAEQHMPKRSLHDRMMEGAAAAKKRRFDW